MSLYMYVCTQKLKFITTVYINHNPHDGHRYEFDPEMWVTYRCKTTGYYWEKF